MSSLEIYSKALSKTPVNSYLLSDCVQVIKIIDYNKELRSKLATFFKQILRNYTEQDATTGLCIHVMPRLAEQYLTEEFSSANKAASFLSAKIVCTLALTYRHAYTSAQCNFLHPIGLMPAYKIRKGLLIHIIKELENWRPS